MLAGYTKSGKPIYKSLFVINGKFSLIGRKYEAEDHFDAHCLFSFLNRLERSTHGLNEFERHYEVLASLHQHAFIMNKRSTDRPDYYSMHPEEKVKYGQFLANLSKIAFQA